MIEKKLKVKDVEKCLTNETQNQNPSIFTANVLTPRGGFSFHVLHSYSSKQTKEDKTVKLRKRFKVGNPKDLDVASLYIIYSIHNKMIVNSDDYIWFFFAKKVSRKSSSERIFLNSFH